ncbi:MAG: ATP-binding response regulator [Candidatus Anammoxibacter sp.]
MIKFTNYKIVEEIYKGNKTVVYKGIGKDDGKQVILKTIRDELPTLEDIAKLKHEYTITRDLDIEGIVQPYGFEKQDNTFVLIQEDFGGVSLNNVITPSGIEVAEFLNIAIQIAKTLGEIHNKQIIHKDVKPANIIINTNTGQVKITDFGISSVLSREYQDPGNPELTRGSLAYMSPEQTGRMNRIIDYRTDLYSTGITFYEMLTGKLPFDAKDSMEWVHCHIAKIPDHPDKIKQTIPEAISLIVMKLLAKSAEDRYQSAYGLKTDLEKCLHQLQTKSRIEEFEPGRYDVPDTLQIPQKLFGRENEIDTLMTAFDRICGGGVEKILVSGFSGIGKSALIHEILKPVVKQRGYFISGKFDQLQRNIPYICLIQAYRELIRQLLTESEENVAIWKEKLLEVLAVNIQVVIDVIPILELIVGKQPKTQELPPAEAQNRFNMVMRKFISALSGKEHPLVIFLDDLQWVDSASLKLIQLIMTDTDIDHLLIIGAYRENEVNNTHPLILAIDDMKNAGSTISHISLGPLTPESINQLVSDTLRCKSDECAPLSKLITEKTGGNPFFVIEFLKTLYQENVLTFDSGKMSWRWELESIVKMGITENVVELMENKIKKLQEQTRKILTFAACVGNRFDLNTLSIVTEKPEKETISDLWEAMKEGLVIADCGLRIEEFDLEDDYCELKNSNPKSQMFRFLHDRVQQAAYSLIPEDIRSETHLKIGNLILKNSSGEKRDENVFEIVNHLNFAGQLVTGRNERKILAELNLTAGKKAMQSTAYEVALKYLSAGTDMLPGDSWQVNYDLTLSLYMQRSECEYLCGNFNVAEPLFDLILKNVKSPLEKTRVFNTKILLYTNQNKFEDAIKLGIEGLKQYGIKLSLRPGKVAILLEYMRSRWYRIKRSFEGKKTIKELYNLPDMSDPEKLEVMSILKNLPAPAYFFNMDLFALVNLKMVNLSLRYGNTDVSSFGYATYGMILGGVFGDYTSGYEFGELALRLNKRFDNVSLKNKAPFVFYSFIKHWKKHVRNDVDSLTGVYHTSLECGDLIYAGYTLVIAIMKAVIRGDYLDDVQKKSENYLDFLNRIKDKNSAFYITIVKQFALCLKGLTNEHVSFNDENYDETDQLKLMEDENAIVPLHWYYIFKLKALFIFKEYDDALKMAEKSSRMMEASLGQIYLAEHYLFYSLTVASLFHEKNSNEKKIYWRILNKNKKKLKKWAANCPENFLNKYLLVCAEMAKLSGKDREAMDLYDRAIESAHDNEFIQNEAIANERAAIFFFSKGKEKIARGYLTDSRYCYHRWGADAKVKDLEEEYPQIFVKHEKIKDSSKTGLSSSSSSSTESDLLDLTTIIKASQAISSEIILEKLLNKMMTILIENAGAQRGLIIMEKDGALVIEAEGEIDSNEIKVMNGVPVDESGIVPVSVIKYTARTHENVVLDNALSEGRFTGDCYIKNHKLKSLLSMAIVNRGRLIGILYLENNLAKGVFTDDRLELLKILSAQVAVSIENALFYSTLENKVKERTEELIVSRDNERHFRQAAESATRAKSTFLANMSHEIRTPLTSIVGFSQILLKESKEHVLPDDFKQFLQIIKESGENLSELINNILDLSKIEAGKTTLAMENLNLKLLFQGIFHVNKAQAIKKNINFTYTYDPDLPEIIYSDRTKLNQILMNLASNAIKFTPEEKAVNLKAVREKDVIVFEVEDQGIGIAPDRQESIFEAFEQAETSTTKLYGGTGLGLSIAKSMVKLLKGEISLKSEEGKGTVFIVKIPLIESDEKLTVKKEINWDDIKFLKDNKVLIVEDNVMNQQMIRALFKELGLEVDIASDGKAGIEMAINLKPDLIIMDMHMPKMDGLETTRRLHRQPECKDIPIIFLSADALGDRQKEAKEEGIDDYLTKPININELIAVLTKYLRYEQQDLLPDTATENPSMPEDIQTQLIDEFAILAKIPHYLTGKISSQVKQMLVLCKGYNSPFTEILKQIDEAAFSKNSKKVEDLIKKAVNYAKEE